MKKRGDITLWFLIETAAAFLIAFLMTNVVLGYVNLTIYEKLNIAKDISMQINALSSIPGDAYIINSNLHGYSVYFSDNRVEVAKDSLDEIKGTYYFTKIGATKLDMRFEKPNQIVIAKIGNEIRISDAISNLG